MRIKRLLGRIGYADSPCFLTGRNLRQHPGYAHIFRQASLSCALRGVYVLREQAGENLTGSSIVPIVYVCEAKSHEEAERIHQLVWNQNVVPFVLVSTPSEIRLYPGFRFKPQKDNSASQAILSVANSAVDLLSRLEDFTAKGIDGGSIWRSWSKEVTPEARVDWTLLANLKGLSEWLRSGTEPLDRHNAHALIGRYVYLKYLRDRKILSDGKLKEWRITHDEVFSRTASVEALNKISCHLDEWLNGSVFPLPPRKALSDGHVQKVAGVFFGDEPTGQLHLPFAAYDFAHIPIETLSEVYEMFLHAEGEGRKLGAYYTPIHLVNFILDELDARSPLKQGMKVLDPACGSGAFLVQCYRRLIERQIASRKSGRLRPAELRELMTSHIYGVDIDEDACGVTELSLALTLLDYVRPPDLRAHPTFRLPLLRNKNIFLCPKGFFDPDSDWARNKQVTGYDWIVGNPPWKELDAKDVQPQEKLTLEWIRTNKDRFPIGGYQVAEAFAWKTVDSLSARGIVGLLLPAMTLFKKQSEAFRRKFFVCNQVWCVVNFANLAEVLFAGRSRVPACAMFFSILSEAAQSSARPGILTYAPLVANQLANRPGDLGRRQETWSITVNASEVREVPVLEAAGGGSLPWKLAMWGSARDKRLLESVKRKSPSTLCIFAQKHRLLVSEGIPLRKKGADEPLDPLPEVRGKWQLNMDALRECGQIYAFLQDALKRVEPDWAFVRKNRGELPLAASRPPHIIVDVARRFAVYSEEFIAVPARQIGIAGNADQAPLLKALALYLSSDFAKYHQYLLGAQCGIQKLVVNKETLEQIPVPLDALGPDDLAELAKLHDDLAVASRKRQEHTKATLFEQDDANIEELQSRLNKAVFDYLGITPEDQWLVRDFLDVRIKLNQGKLAKEAMQSASEADMATYAKALQAAIEAFFDEDMANRHGVTVFYSRDSAMVKVVHGAGVGSRQPTVEKVDAVAARHFDNLRSRLLKPYPQWLYFNRNLSIFQGRTTYVFKPRERLHWLRSQALLDADAFIAEKVAATGGIHQCP